MTSSSLDDYPGHNFTSVAGHDRRTQTIIRHESRCQCGFGPYNWSTRGEDHRDHVLAEVVRAAKVKAWDEGSRATHAALGGQFIWFAPENPYRSEADHGTD